MGKKGFNCVQGDAMVKYHVRDTATASLSCIPRDASGEPFAMVHRHNAAGMRLAGSFAGALCDMCGRRGMVPCTYYHGFSA